MSEVDGPGALVLSLDFELHWGVRDHSAPDGPYRANLLGARTAVGQMLARFAAADVACTWATVGMLFPPDRATQRAWSPTIRPRYLDPRLDPYRELVGEGERDDPLHFAPSLVAAIRATPRQELGTHTWSHYYCLEPGQDAATFEADLAAAQQAAVQAGTPLRSIVFPRNQHNPAYDPILQRHGIIAYRGNPVGWMHRAVGGDEVGPALRAARWLDLHLGAAPPRTYRWDQLRQSTGLVNVPASFFLRPVGHGPDPLGRLRLARIMHAIRYAARARRLVHLWWHPHNFGIRQQENLARLDAILAEFDRLRRAEGMRSLSMGEVGELARG